VWRRRYHGRRRRGGERRCSRGGEREAEEKEAAEAVSLRLFSRDARDGSQAHGAAIIDVTAAGRRENTFSKFYTSTYAQALEEIRGIFSFVVADKDFRWQFFLCLNGHYTATAGELLHIGRRPRSGLVVHFNSLCTMLLLLQDLDFLHRDHRSFFFRNHSLSFLPSFLPSRPSIRRQA
jgi:hypothetical protein